MAPLWCLTFRPVRGASTAALDCAAFPLCQHPPRTEILVHHASITIAETAPRRGEVLELIDEKQI
jgi:hypothetical protein